jgi:hypothetical protein
MANPNIVNVGTIIGRTTGVNLTSTVMTTLLNNGANSNTALKLNVLNMTNYGNSAIAVSVSYYTAANQSGTEYKIVHNLNVPIGTVLTVIDKSSGYYMEENSSLAVRANIANAIFATASYEEII